MIDLKSIFPKGSKSFFSANAPPSLPSCPNKTRSSLSVGARNGIHEANHQREIPNTKQCEQAPALGSEAKRKAPGARCPIVGFTLYRVKLLDWEAKYSSVKDLLDGLCYAGLVDGDREDQIDPKSYVIQKKVRSYAEEKTVIELII